MRAARRRKLFAVASVALVVLLGLATTELALWVRPPRATFRAWRDASITFELDDETDWRLEPRVYPWGTIGSQGLRGGEHAATRAPGTFRILVLGGSSTFDVGKTDETAWPARVARKLGSVRDRRVVVVNAGTPGFSSWQSRRLLAGRLAACEVDLILVAHAFNDLLTFRFEDRASIIEAWKENGRANAISTWVTPSTLFGAIGTVMPRTTDAVRFWLVRRALAATRAEHAKVWGAHPRVIGAAGPAFYEENVEAIAAMAKARGVPIGLIAEPTLVRANMSEADHARLTDWVQLPLPEHARAYQLA
jgi:hypothetical protein